jgi:hypothetical protein
VSKERWAVLTTTAAAFSPDGRQFITAWSNPVKVWDVPAPLEGEAERIRLWVEVTTGLEVDAGGAVVELDAKAWQERQERLQKLGGPP